MRQKSNRKQGGKERVSGSLRVKLFSEFIDSFIAEVRRAKVEMSTEAYEKLTKGIATQKNKRSEEEARVMEGEFADSVKDAFLQVYAAELKSGYRMTAIMGGRVFLRIVTKSNNLERELDCELIARKIPTEMDEFVEKFGSGNGVLKGVPINEKKKFLKLHEAHGAVKENSQLTLENALKATN